MIFILAVLIIGLSLVHSIPPPGIEPVQCGDIEVTPYPLTDLSSVIGNYYDLDIRHRKPKICAESNYSLHGTNIFSRNTELHILDDVQIPIIGNGQLIGLGTFHIAMDIGGLDTINFIFYLLATDKKSYIVLLTCRKGKPWVVIETKSPTVEAYNDALKALEKLKIPTNLVNTKANLC